MKFFFWTLSFHPDYLIQPSDYPKVKKICPYKGRRGLRFRAKGDVFIKAAAETANRADEYLWPTFSCYTLSNDKKNATSKKKKMNFRLFRRFTVKTWILVKYDV